MVSPLHNPHIPSLENRIGTGEKKKKNQKIPQRTKAGQKLYFCKGRCQHRKCLKILAQWTTMERLQQPFQSANCFGEGPNWPHLDTMIISHPFNTSSFSESAAQQTNQFWVAKKWHSIALASRQSVSRARGSEQRRLYLPSFSLVICGVPAQRAIFSVAGTKGRGKTGTESVNEGSDPGKESKQTPAGRGRTLNREGIRSPPRAARTQEPRGWQEPHGRQRAVGSAAEFASGPPRPRLACHFDPECSTQSPRTGRSGEGQGAVWASPGPPQARSPSSTAPRIPRLRPAPRLRRSAPSARPGPAVAAAECHGAIALLPFLCTISERRSTSSPEGAGAVAFSPEAREGGKTREGKKAGGGGEKEGRWPGQGVGGEGSRTAAAAASSPRPPQLFVQSRAVPAPSPSGPTTDSTGEDALGSWGPAAPSSPLLASRKQT